MLRRRRDYTGSNRLGLGWGVLHITRRSSLIHKVVFGAVVGLHVVLQLLTNLGPVLLEDLALHEGEVLVTLLLLLLMILLLLGDIQ